MIVKYRERFFIDPYRCIDRYYTIRADSMFTQGNLIYFRLDRFNLKVIAKEDIIDITE